MTPARSETARYRQSLIAAGGTDPISTSRVTPPMFPATNERTRAPNRSSCRDTPALAPLIANTKVPTRSSTSTSSDIAGSFARGACRKSTPSDPPGSSMQNPQIRENWISAAGEARCTTGQSMDRRLRRQPSLRGDDQGLDAGLQCRVNNRREQRAVVDGELIEPARLLGLRVDVGVGPADEPEHGRNVPLGPERSEVLARRRGPGLPDALGGEVAAKRIGDAPGRIRVIHVQGVLIELRDLRPPRCA